MGLSKMIDSLLGRKMIKVVPEKASDPAAIPETGGDPLDALKRRKKRSGRTDTIRAGSLIPTDTGTKSLLG